MTSSYVCKIIKLKKNIPATRTIDVDWIHPNLGIYISENLPRTCFTFQCVDENVGREKIQRITFGYQPVDGYFFDEEIIIKLSDKMDRAPTVTYIVEMVDEEEAGGSESAVPGNLSSNHDSILSHSKQASLECKVCCQLYSDSIHNCIPRILTECGHTICHSCAETLQKMSPDKLSIDCPFDRISTKVKVELLRKNFAIIDLIRERSEEEKMATEMGTVEISEDPILPCYENPRHEATRFCQSCAQDYCDSCYRLVHASRINSEHVSILISEKPVKIPHCPNHPDHTAEYFCQDKKCKSASPLCCSKCSKKHHKNHDMVSPTEKIDQNHIRLTALFQSLQLAKTKVSGALKRADRCIRSTDKANAKYWERVVSINRHFDRMKAEAIQNLESFVDHKREGMETDKKHIEHDMELINHTKKEVEKVLKRRDLLFAEEIIEKGEAICSLDLRKEANLVELSLPSLEEIIESSSKPPVPSHRAPAPPKVPSPPPRKSYRARTPTKKFSSS